VTSFVHRNAWLSTYWSKTEIWVILRDAMQSFKTLPMVPAGLGLTPA
jgi:hypothetical protein